MASAKALTRRYDLTLGICESLEKVLEAQQREQIELVCLSTTLATNAIVEGQGSRICLILIGYPADALDQSRLGEVTGQDPVIFLRGGHDACGEEIAALDMSKARKAVEAFAGRVSAFAVSGYFSVRNPSHENAVRALIRERSGLPVTCGHELTSNLHATRRALTAALNARLVSVLSELIRAVQSMLDEHRINAPLMVVKGDGSLVEAKFALEYPIETILSGPAASVVGSLYLSGEQNACVVDMGGTTTDIALVENGKPILNKEGATVGGWQTMTEAVQIYTYGLGGDSEVHLHIGGGMSLGPRRLLPLSLLSDQHEGIIAELPRQSKRPDARLQDVRFVVRQRLALDIQGTLGELQQEILNRLETNKPVALDRLLRSADSEFLMETELRRLTDMGLIVVAGFTPTDAAHVLGLQDSWSREAAQIGAEVMARRYSVLQGCDISVERFCRDVIERVVLQSGRAVVEAVLAEGHGLDVDSFPDLRKIFVDRAIVKRETRTDLLRVNLSLTRPLIAIGAPVAVYYPEVARRIDSKLTIPPHASVANALGAVVGSVMQSVTVLISPQSAGEVFRVHFEEGIRDFFELDEAAAFAAETAETKARDLAEKAGASAITVRSRRRDHNARVGEEEFLLESIVTAVASGRPRLAHDEVKPQGSGQP